jgi:hypothetical protein
VSTNNKTVSIFSGNGLGNQLFVYAYLCKLISIDKDIKIKFLNTRSPREWTQFYIQDLLLKVPNISVSKASGFIYSLRVRFPKLICKLIKRNSNLALQKLRIFNEGKVFSYEPTLLSIPNHSVVFGTFISTKYFATIENEVLTNIKNWLDDVKTDFEFREFCGEDFITIHVRRGDTISVASHRSRGVMGKDYYSEAIELIEKRNNLNSKIIVVTDDLHNSKLDLQNLNVSKWLGPVDLSPVETLKLITTSKSFIGCNSTFSWWGAKLLNHYGNKNVYLPKPWYLNQKVDDEIFISGVNYLEWK